MNHRNSSSILMGNKMSETRTVFMPADKNTERDQIEIPDFSAKKVVQSANKQGFEKEGMVSCHVNIEDLASNTVIDDKTNAKDINLQNKNE